MEGCIGRRKALESRIIAIKNWFIWFASGVDPCRHIADWSIILPLLSWSVETVLLISLIFSICWKNVRSPESKRWRVYVFLFLSFQVWRWSVVANEPIHSFIFLSYLIFFFLFYSFCFGRFSSRTRVLIWTSLAFLFRLEACLQVNKLILFIFMV